MISTDIGIWVSVILIICVLTFIIKDTPLFRFSEATLVGVTAGVLAAQGLQNVNRLAWIPLITKADYISIIPILLGILMFTRVSKQIAYISRMPVAIMLGAGVGVAVTRTMATEIIQQAGGLFKAMPSSTLDIINQIIFLICTIGVLLFFTYTRAHVGGLGFITRIGRYALMLGLGSIYAGHIYARAAWLLPILQRIVWDWLGITL